MPRPLAAVQLMNIQLITNPANLFGSCQLEFCIGKRQTCLKNAIREIERSSLGVREDANMDRSSAGVTGMRLDCGGWGCC